MQAHTISRASVSNSKIEICSPMVDLAYRFDVSWQWNPELYQSV